MTMSDINDCFNIGSIVHCQTCFNQEIEGEVIAFDPITSTILLKTPNASGKSTSYDVRLVNLRWTRDIKVVKDVNSSPPPSLLMFNCAKIISREKKALDDKRNLLEAMQSGANTDAQKLYSTISKTIGQVYWSGSKIVVMDEVVISAPYLLDNVNDKDPKQSKPQAVSFVKKIVDKFYKDQKATVLNNSPGLPADSKAHSSSQGHSRKSNSLQTE